MLALEAGIRRITFPLPWGPMHVHSYLLPGPDGYTLVDTGFGDADPEERWAPILAALAAPVVRIFLTHYHPDHVGGTADVVALTGAEVVQGRLDASQAGRAWGDFGWARELAAWLRRHGSPADIADDVLEHAARIRANVHYTPAPMLVDEGDSLDGWRVLVLPGHADGHLALLRDGLLVGGDTLLASITPHVGLHPESRSDPLGDYLDSLDRIASLAPRVVLPGHGEPIADPPLRARETREHHSGRLEATRAALEPGPRSAYEVSLALWRRDLTRVERRFAIAEALSHLERVRGEGGVERDEDEGVVRWRAS